MQKEHARLNERADKDRQDFLAQIERLKTELKDRY
jgi:hypothetical protein